MIERAQYSIFMNYLFTNIMNRMKMTSKCGKKRILKGGFINCTICRCVRYE